MFRINPQFKNYRGPHTLDGMLSVCHVLTRKMYDAGTESVYYFDKKDNVVVESLAHSVMEFCDKLIADGIVNKFGKRKSAKKLIDEALQGEHPNIEI